MSWKLQVVSLAMPVSGETGLETGNTHVEAEFICGDRFQLIESVKAHLKAKGVALESPNAESKVSWVLVCNGESRFRADIRLDFPLPRVFLPENRLACTLIGKVPDEVSALIDSRSNVYIELEA